MRSRSSVRTARMTMGAAAGGRSATRELRGSGASISGLQVLCRREVARLHRIREELLRIVGPELAHGGIGLHHRVHELAAAALDLADVGGHDGIGGLYWLSFSARVVHGGRGAAILH